MNFEKNKESKSDREKDLADSVRETDKGTAAKKAGNIELLPLKQQIFLLFEFKHFFFRFLK